MKLGGLIGSAVLRNVPVALRTLLLAGSLVHVGKAAVFGHGKLEVAGRPETEDQRSSKPDDTVPPASHM